jgi:hypothetical protein
MQAPGCCTVVHIERCMTSAWPGISPGRITHTQQTGDLFLTAFSHCLCYPELQWNVMLVLWNVLIAHYCLYLVSGISVRCFKDTMLLFAFRN